MKAFFKRFIKILFIISLAVILNVSPILDRYVMLSNITIAEANPLLAFTAAEIIEMLLVSCGLVMASNSEEISKSLSDMLYNNSTFIKNWVDKVVSEPNSFFYQKDGKNLLHVPSDIRQAVLDSIKDTFGFSDTSKTADVLSHSTDLGYVDKLMIDGFNAPVYNHNDIMANNMSLFTDLPAGSPSIGINGNIVYESIDLIDGNLYNYFHFMYDSGATSAFLRSTGFKRNPDSKAKFITTFYYTYSGNVSDGYISVLPVFRTDGGWDEKTARNGCAYGAVDLRNGTVRSTTGFISDYAFTIDLTNVAVSDGALGITTDDSILSDIDTNDAVVTVVDGSYVGVRPNDVVTTFDPSVTTVDDVVATIDPAVPDVDTNTGTTTITGDITIKTNYDGKINWEPLKMPGKLLSTKFPFCLPFDLYNAFTCFDSLKSNGSPLHFNLPIDMGYLGIYEIDIDFKEYEQYNTMAAMVKYFIYLSFMVGLIIITRKLIGGE